MVKTAPYANPNYIVDGDMSSDITGGWVQIPFNSGVSINAVWTGVDTPAGNFKIQGSNDKTNIEDLSGGTFAAGGGSGSFLWAGQDVLVKFIRVFYDRTGSGSGDTVDVGIIARGN